MTSAASTTEVATPSAANVTRVRFILPPLAIRRIAPPMSIGGAAGVPGIGVPPFGEHGCHAAARCGYRHEIMASPDPGESRSATEDITVRAACVLGRHTIDQGIALSASPGLSPHRTPRVETVTARRLARSRALRADVDRVQVLARRHE